MSMSNQQSQRVRRNASPGANKQGPLRATVPVSLMKQTSSPTRNIKKGSPSNSPTLTWPSDGSKAKHRRSPDSRISPERNSPLSPSSKADNAKTFNIKSVNSAPYIRRTASLDTIYLYSQWQRDAFYLNYCGRLMVERSTQTPDEWDDTKISCQKRNNVSSGDQLEKKYIRQRLQRTNQSSRVSGGMSTYQRHSPIQGDHFAISSTQNAGGNTPGSTSHLPSTPPALPSTIVTSSVTSPYQLSYSVPTHTVPTTSLSSSGSSRTIPIPIPHIPKPLIPRMRSSVEGLNQEIERLVLRGFSSIEADGDSEKVLEPTPDGHRAPIAELFCITHNVDTQTPLVGGESDPSSGATSRSHSISPVIPGPMDNSRPPSMEESKSASPDGETSCKLGTSPHINKFLAREPPDGCEKVKIVEEPRKSTSLPESSGYRSLQPKFVLQPSQSSAFYPLCKNSDFPSPTEKTIKQINSPTHVPTDEKHQ